MRGQLPLLVALAAVYGLILVSIIIDDLMREGEIGLWDWVGVLIIPVALTAGGIWLNNTQVRREEALAHERAQDEALQQYLDQMSDLLINQRLHKQRIKSAVHLLAQARTATVLLMLDEHRKRRPSKLVYRLDLINRDNPLLDLDNAALENADLTEISLTDACLRGVDLRRANLNGSKLSGIDLSDADLRGADLSGACLKVSNLLPYNERNPAKMIKHNLNGAAPIDLDQSSNDLKPTNLTGAILRDADLSGALLVSTEGLTHDQIDQAIGDRMTQLPGHLRQPVAWSKSINEQPQTGGTSDAIKEVGKELVRTTAPLAASVLIWQLLLRHHQYPRPRSSPRSIRFS